MPRFCPSSKTTKTLNWSALHPLVDLHAQHSGKKFGFQYATSSEDEIINDPNINTVAILTRHDSHADLVVKALESWQTCLCGKTAGDQ